jgi:CHAT domain-containing protein
MMKKLLSIKAIARYLITGLGIAAICCSPLPSLAQEARLERARETIADFPTDLEAARQKGKEEEAYTLNQVGRAYLEIGNYEEAKKHLTISLQLYREVYASATKVEGLPDFLFRPMEREVFGSLVIAHEKLGDVQGLNFLESELAATSDIDRRKMILHILGISYNGYLGEATFADAVDVWEEHLQLSKQLNDRFGEASSLFFLGQIYVALKDYDRGIEYTEQAIQTMSLSDQAHEYGMIVGYLAYLSRYQKEKGDFDAALATLDRQLKAEQNLHLMVGKKDADYRGWGLIDRAHIYSAAGDYEKAIAALEQKIAIEEEQSEGLADPWTLGLLSSNLFWQGDLNRAIAIQQQSVTNNLAEHKNYPNSILSGLPRDRTKLAFFLLRSGRLQEAEKSLELALEEYDLWYKRYRTSVDSGRLSTDRSNLAGQNSFAAPYRLLQEIYIARDRPGDALEASESGRARAFSQLMARRLEDRSHPLIEFSSPNLEEIKAIAKAEQTTIVEYSIIFDVNHHVFTNTNRYKSQRVAQKLYIWVVKPTGEIHFREVPLEGDLVKLVRQARGLISSSKQLTRRLQVSLQKLHGVLVEPIADLLPTDPSDRVTFIPQEMLFYVPFPALTDLNGQSLIEKHTILTAPSIQVLSLSRQIEERLKPNSKAFVLGNPDMPTLPRTPHTEPYILAPLPGSETEAKKIAQMFNVSPLLGSAATKDRAIAKMEEAGIIHIATHGLLDRSGLLASLALAPTRNDDGFLTAREIANLNLNAELVVLSACDTGRGEFYEGEGVVGLARAFLSAGSSNLVMSLWPVPDNATAILMTEFYQSWQGGMSKSEALREAMLATKAQFPNPKNWAAFSIVGTGD